MVLHPGKEWKGKGKKRKENKNTPTPTTPGGETWSVEINKKECNVKWTIIYNM